MQYRRAPIPRIMARDMGSLSCGRVVIGLLAGAGAMGALGCNASLRALREPRPGRSLNERVALVFSSRYRIRFGGLERLHPFDINKYTTIYHALERDGYVRPDDVYVPAEISRDDLLTVHTERYLAELRRPAALARYLEFPLAALMTRWTVDRAILRPFRHAAGGTLLAAREAMQCGIAVNLGGGYHHAGPDSGGGFCIYADMPIAIRCLQRDGLIRRALVVDLDAHQGNGTAVAFADDDSVYTFSMHQAGIYPQPPAESDMDVELEAGTDDDAFMATLTELLPGVLADSRPDIIFLQAGVDPLADDPLAGLAMSERGIVRRDAYVIDLTADAGTPLVMCLGGGYSRESWHAQYLSIKRTLDRYGLADGHPQYGPGR